MPAQQNSKPASCTAAFTGGVFVGNKHQAQAQSQHPPNWSHVQPPKPVHSGYVQPQYNQQSSQPYYQSEPAYAVNQNQYQPQQVRLCFSNSVFLSCSSFFFVLCPTLYCSPFSLHGISIKSRKFLKCFFFRWGTIKGSHYKVKDL